MSLFYAWAVLKLCTPLHTHNGELSGGWIVVQSGVHDAGVHSCVVLCNISDGEAVRVHDQSAKTFSRSLWTEWMCFFFFYNIQYTKDPAYIHNSTQIPDKDLIFCFKQQASRKKTSPDIKSSDLSSSGSSPSSLSQVIVGMSEGSCFTVHSNTTDRPLWTSLYSGCFRIRVGSVGGRIKWCRSCETATCLLQAGFLFSSWQIQNVSLLNLKLAMDSFCASHLSD